MADNPALPVFWIWVGLTGLAVGVAALAPRLLEWGLVWRPIRVLHLQSAGQPVGEQSGEFRGILQRTALGEKSCAIKQFGGVNQ
jgi:hypothetical protein